MVEKSKIALNILQNTKEQGGLNLVNLKNKDISLKATWPLILHQEKDYGLMVYHFLRCKTIKQDIWRCTMLPEDAKKMRISNQFWKDVLVAWNHLNSSHDFRMTN